MNVFNARATKSKTLFVAFKTSHGNSDLRKTH